MILNKNILSIELNEINHEWLEFYANSSKLNNIKKILQLNKVVTTSETNYRNLEPWIQWPTFYSGKSFNKHKCFHLGDSLNKKYYSIYDFFQDQGFSVLAFAPMNCTFNPINDSVLIHDPWSSSGVINANNDLKKLWDAISFFVNENSNKSFKLSYAVTIFLNLIKYMRLTNICLYSKLLFMSVFFKWARAIFLDLFLFDIFISLIKKNKYKYASVFLNAGAHIQHHYLYDSKFYRSINGQHKNPLSYSSRLTKYFDPLFQVYNMYDKVAGDILQLSNINNVSISTGLQQEINPTPYFQYRIKNYQRFFNLFKLKFSSYEKKMSRDVYIYFKNKNDLNISTNIFKAFTINKKPLFEVWPSNSEKSLFVKFVFGGSFSQLKNVQFQNRTINLCNHFIIVSIENAIHQSEGWHYNNFHKFEEKKIPLKNLAKLLFSSLRK